MTADEEWGLPEDAETTAVAEKRQAEGRVQRAATGQVKTEAVVSRVERVLGEIREMHSQNHYREILLPILQGSHRGA